MNLVTKLGVVTLAAITVAPLATSTISPVNAQAKTVKKAKKVSKKKAKTYKISKKVLRSKKNIMVFNKSVIVEQNKANNLRIIDSASADSNAIDYKVTGQKVKGKTMTMKLTPKLSKREKKYGLAKGAGMVKITRTGKNSYKMPIYSGNGGTRVNGNKVQFQNQWWKEKRTTYKGKLTSLKTLKTANNKTATSNSNAIAMKFYSFY
ncbi:hypothetical protein D1831_03845 [Lactiplantibacillus garii]|uniref:Extracellular protein n=1 Tax=Lactiplantibacillus garii TaxID=2306423 RepID=A0A426D943_9LACO|nr:hypothetical protein [Lactiplantibacillus garii]RRK11086.1 hypothetical protein D1831_03845 [Lactiplantibacillus garii]